MLSKLILVLMLTTPAFGTTYFVSQSGTTSNCLPDGTSSQATISVATLNGSSTYWQPGNKIALCGTITTQLYAQGGGSSGSVLTIQFETGASIQITPGCDSNGCIHLGYSYVLVDGGAGQPCGWNTATNVTEGTCNGQIENMLSGTNGQTCPGGTCNGTLYGNLIYAGSNVGNIEIRNLNLGPQYIHTANAAGLADNNIPGGVTTNQGSNWNVHDNKMHDSGWFFTLNWGSGTITGMQFSNNEFYFCGHTFAVGGAGAGSLTFVVNGNYDHDHYNWDMTSDDEHHNFVHVFSSGLNGTVNATYYNNIMGGQTGTYVTAQFFSEEMTTVTEVIFNNVINLSSNSSGNGWGPAMCNSNCFFYNNTVSYAGQDVSVGYSTYTFASAFENNALLNSSTLLNLAGSATSLSPFDYNAYGPALSSNIWVYRGADYNGSQFSAWKTASGEGSHSFYNGSGLTLNASLQPQTGSPLIAAGVNVCVVNASFCTSYPAIKSDIAGTVRPTSGAWDIGAYQAGVAPPTNIPSLTNGVVVTNGVILSQ
jgi:hypothetical protein